ncbi:hypothetical protein CEP52_008625 [Fusarium oligoseptatum]|uniref:CorA-like transporter domain-containing protein n=1 Tax=Fusarium oligoseptatum TaxID=2604345 RepID=A0A428TH17_9HYPO|nr:hypothetical protein CEP52_008625 [Fusarium oligoseptatum]
MAQPADAHTEPAPPAVCQTLWSCDAQSIREKLAAKAPSLFATQADEVKVWSAKLAGDQTTASYEFEEHDFTDGDLVPLEQVARDIFYLIPQLHSWDRLRVSKETFTKITEYHEVFPYFSETVRSFGLRTESDPNTWNNFHSRSAGPDADVETCYTVRFFEKNNREAGDPWSLRKTGVYHRLDAATCSSTWILIKPSPLLKNRLPEKLKALWSHEQLRPIRYLYLHVMLIALASQSWEDYIQTQRTKMMEIERKCLYSDTDINDPKDYPISFSDRQKLQQLRRKLITATAVLDSTISLGQKLRKLLPTMGGSRLTKQLKEVINTELYDLDFEANYHRRSLLELRQRSSDMETLLSGILEHRNAQATMDMSVNSEMERGLEQKSSTNIRALTVVATLYLPASLLAGIFSTPLVQPKSEAEPGDQLVVSAEFWKFVVVLTPLSIATFALVRVLQHFWTRKHEAELGEMKKGRGSPGSTDENV